MEEIIIALCFRTDVEKLKNRVVDKMRILWNYWQEIQRFFFLWNEICHMPLKKIFYFDLQYSGKTSRAYFESKLCIILLFPYF